jgi:Zn-dependent M28 family amino/carboxypeptidase
MAMSHPAMASRAAVVSALRVTAGALAQPPRPPASAGSSNPHEGGAIIREKDTGKDWMSAPDAEAKAAAAALGESPVATLLDVLGPEVRRFEQHIMALSDPYFEGRAAGSRGNERAAEYIEFYFRKAGLKPAFPTEVKAADGSTVIDPSSSYRQAFRAGVELKVKRQELMADLGGGPKLLEPGKDYVVLGSSGSAEVKDAPVVFVGYGVAEGKDGYSSFGADGDLSGKVAMVLRFEPLKEDGTSRWAEHGWSPASSLDEKLAAVQEHKAAAIILVNAPGAADPRATELMDTKVSAMASRRITVPVMMMSTEAADRLVRRAAGNRSLMKLRKSADEKGGVTELGVQVSIGAELAREPVMTGNVGGVLEGRGRLKDEYIVIGGHFDHIGYGEPYGIMEERNAGKLHPGADDNGSGTAGVLMLADRMAREYAALPSGAEARSVLFLAFSGEESGLIGSAYWVNHPSVSLSLVTLMINMDMIGRLREGKIQIDGVESAAGFREWLRPMFEKSGLAISAGYKIPGNSDHASFYGHEIPVLNLFTGYHLEYHRPGDEGYTINPVGAVRVLDLVREVAMAVARRPERLTYTKSVAPGGGDEEGGAEPAAAPGPVAVKVRFGITPGYIDDGEGVLVDDVHEGTSAAEAGVRKGDRLIRWGGKKLESVEGWLPLLSGAKPGDVVEVVVLRDGKEVPITVKLKARGGKD